ncbi:hypothetical protein OPT61_g9518 [Boeremia exigua]|uniref:Uncharacterized protein n=1 Tax=Boeremia exigua TaxID=749465 RepID=A0ACC2HTR0_9PLEO|nr:hypothetical protein OPT61_g9518 [Boeremia exigua]
MVRASPAFWPSILQSFGIALVCYETTKVTSTSYKYLSTGVGHAESVTLFTGSIKELATVSKGFRCDFYSLAVHLLCSAMSPYRCLPVQIRGPAAQTPRIHASTTTAAEQRRFVVQRLG